MLSDRLVYRPYLTNLDLSMRPCSSLHDVFLLV